MLKYITLILFWVVQPSFAETIVTPDQFEKLSTDKTLYFSFEGKPFGVEQFFKDRRSKWRYEDGTCEDGEWFADNDLICFNYDGGLETICWHFLKTDDGYAARAEGAPKNEVLKLESIDTKPLLCSGKGLAV
ncbi:hypothetical protein F9L33_01690 [Amylibacter sp. SFDW26]|uniref:hypothetical protein n=1 Tax=Amylibacter sp. SFDW26 TaxID=2652722 RepID=UPI0012629A0A|nr:hypothetical protein [Amylibacter sp. SFDW26]KAB7615502.1 hypothetical protein F9L33_01690 [Amylibacter sp. SFDW26]